MHINAAINEIEKGVITKKCWRHEFETGSFILH